MESEQARPVVFVAAKGLHIFHDWIHMHGGASNEILHLALTQGRALFGKGFLATRASLVSKCNLSGSQRVFHLSPAAADAMVMAAWEMLHGGFQHE